MHYYLPQETRLRWADALARAGSPVFDWRDALAPPQGGEATPTEDALVSRLKSGQELLAVFPIIRTARWGAPWTKRGAQALRASGSACWIATSACHAQRMVSHVFEGRLPTGVRAVLYDAIRLDAVKDR
jgi:hypothetical protein